MPLRLRLVRVLPPNQRLWQHILAGRISPATAGSQVSLTVSRPRCVGERRTWASASTPRWQDGSNEPAKPSIFEELFPDEARVTRGETAPQPPKELRGSEIDTVPEDVRQWLEGEAEAEAEAEGEGPPTWGPISASSPGKRRTNPTVLVLSGTTASLLPSDFFRIAPRVSSSAAAAEQSDVAGSRPVDGWAASNGGIYKIVQDRDPATLAPRGRYFLYFGSSAAALAYSQEVRDLHTLARRAVQPPQLTKNKARRRHKRRREDQEFRGEIGIGSSASVDAGDSAFASLAGTISSGGSGAGNDAYLVSSATEEEMAALRSFTLLAPTAQLDLVMQMPAGTSGLSTPSSSSSLTLYDEEQLDDVAAINATTKVLVVLTDTSSSGSNITTWSDVDGNDRTGVTTVEGLRSLIEEDGVRRNLPWAVSDGLNGVVPVQWLVAEQKRLLHEAVKASNTRAAARKSKRPGAGQLSESQSEPQSEVQSSSSLPSPAPPPVALWASRVPDLFAKTEQMNENARFSRFVVAFADAVEARRFVRNWHRRAVSVPGTGTAADYEQTAIVDTTVLW
ncbi:hypothetical protein SCUCBS95973_006645 [Sporothrix curviconia]|uniref:Uncharacterized protein n=1 Tax=Sporothrix curviconia TaxID=1260050 RepID=A0ABP0C770_9PEZI